MNGTDRPIQIFPAFGEGYDVMKRVLFQPFDFIKWLTIAFAAFIAGSWGGGFNFNFPRNWSAKTTTTAQNLPSVGDAGGIPGWVIALIVLGIGAALVIGIVIAWVIARGRFVFTDCIVRNRGAIVEPWREFRHEGNSFFIFSVVVTLVVLIIVGFLFLIIALPLGLFSRGNHSAALGAGVVFIIALVALLWIGFSIFFAVVTQFMVPVMYRQRCGAFAAFGNVARLVLHRPGPFVLYLLFGIVLVLAVMFISIMVTCATCCIGGLPYVNTVILLPVFVWLRAFSLCFIRQFGNEYDVWATSPGLPVAASTPIVPPPAAEPPPPPIQT